MKKLSLLICLLVLSIACKDESKEKYVPSAIGAINNVSVVIDNDLWKGEVGDKIREHFAAPVVGLTWEEPLFNLNQLPPQIFTGAIKKTRAIIYVQKDTLSAGHIKTDMFATPQRVGVFKGQTNDEIMANIDAQADKVIAAFKTLEIEEAQKRYLTSPSKDPVLKDTYGVSMTVPAVFKVGRQEPNFVWFDTQIPKGTMNIIAYEMPENAFATDSTFTQDIIKMRDSIGALYIPGNDVPGKITHMRTEPAFAPHVFPTEIGGKKAVEVRGLWDIKNYPMAGPFLTFIINDKEHNRKLALEGFTFAPSTNKRDYMFELEAIMRTIEIE